MHIGIASLRQFQCVPTTSVTEIEEAFFEIYSKTSIVPIVFASYKLLKLPISIKIPVTLPQIVYTYISKFEFMNYLFANLLVER